MISREMIERAREALDRRPEQAEGLPGAFYGEAFYALERKTLFPGSWCAVAVASAIPEPGDILPVDLAGWPIMILRDHAGELRAFHNICRHRALQLVREPMSDVSRIRCPWHSWTYDLEGRLLGTPQLGGAGVHKVEGFVNEDLGLKPLPVGRWMDYIFVNIDGKAAPFAQFSSTLDNLTSTMDLAGLKHGVKLVDTYRGNWKIATEGGIEDYHLPFGHPQLNAHLVRNCTPFFADGVYAGGSVAVGDMDAEAEETDDRPWNAKLPALRARDGGPLKNMLVFNVFPTATIVVSADHVMLAVLLPNSASETTVEINLYFDGEAATSEACAPARGELLDMWREVLPQDFPFVEGSQATVEARDAAGISTRFSPYWEQAVLRFQQMVINSVAE